MGNVDKMVAMQALEGGSGYFSAQGAWQHQGFWGRKVIQEQWLKGLIM